MRTLQSAEGFMRIVVVLGTMITTILSWQAVRAGIFPDTPDMLICSVPALADRAGFKVVLYLDGISDTGERSYKSLGVPALQAIVTKDGRATSTLPDCDGQTLSALRRNGQVADF